MFPRTGMTGAMVLTLLLAAGCGGGGSSSDAPGPAGTGTISGVVTKGPVGNATVTAYGVSDGQSRAQIGMATTDAGGSFTMSIGTYGGPVMVQASGGSYRDEATGLSMGMASGDVMSAMVPGVVAGAGSNGVQVTPVTAMAQAMAQQMPGGMTAANMASANVAMGNYFLVSDILHIQPMNPLSPGAGAAASQDARNYGMTLAAMSQYARTLNMPVSSALITAMMNDASDGMMDGKRGGAQITMTMGAMMGPSMMAPDSATSGLAAAMTAFMNSSANVSGVTPADMAGLMQKLSSSSGKI
ncbi:carboxypeptidase-like regulatory domain-containing protein [Caenimonas terrae]|uniref:Carboxypeptidase-like regulatory domain-containing protein n=1 Tax=Caenimonas terrae TaxID=696074 RepID=A0ABW0NFZ5_9BURK